MSRAVRVALTALAVLVLALVGCQGWRGKEPNPEPEGPTVTIPLGSIYSTSGQRGLLHYDDRGDHPAGRDLAAICQHIGTNASNVLLVRGRNIEAAVNATRWAFTGGRAADVPVDPEDGSERAPIWLLAYLGTKGSTPPAWLVQSVERRGRTVRLNYRKPKRMGGTKDSHHYLYWAPLGKVEPGSYTLELFDTDKKDVTLMRRVSVPGK